MNLLTHLNTNLKTAPPNAVPFQVRLVTSWKGWVKISWPAAAMPTMTSFLTGLQSCPLSPRANITADNRSARWVLMLDDFSPLTMISVHAFVSHMHQHLLDGLVVILRVDHIRGSKLRAMLNLPGLRLIPIILAAQAALQFMTVGPVLPGRTQRRSNQPPPAQLRGTVNNKSG